ncbi:MAG: tRNA (adenosine(37)-N6)-threonylcarbamoyltransferase complex dimerization subunit type 1 TsaB [Deltaproteobacteria bacterium]|nr:tRNA (adenosine(37)-N6)-threonylcarbamoyltransferase complex dimerization subunit type 1 TsaB [Deltaproteobacteria bacterium]
MDFVLAVDASEFSLDVALCADKGQCFSQTTTNREIAENLTPLVTDVISQSGLEINNMAAIAVNQGPGSYSGIRSSLAYVFALSQATQKPIWCLSGLLARAICDYKHNYSSILISLMTANRSEYYCAVFSRFKRPANTPEHTPKGLIFEANDGYDWVELIAPTTIAKDDDQSIRSSIRESIINQNHADLGDALSTVSLLHVDKAERRQNSAIALGYAFQNALREKSKQHISTTALLQNNVMPLYIKPVNALTIKQRAEQK